MPRARLRWYLSKSIKDLEKGRPMKRWFTTGLVATSLALGSVAVAAPPASADSTRVSTFAIVCGALGGSYDARWPLFRCTLGEGAPEGAVPALIATAGDVECRVSRFQDFDLESGLNVICSSIGFSAG
jgi:hypothetical protein